MLPYSQHIAADTSVKVGSNRRSCNRLTDPEGSFLFLVSKKDNIHQNWCSPLSSSPQMDSLSPAINPEQTYPQRHRRWNRDLTSKRLIGFMLYQSHPRLATSGTKTKEKNQAQQKQDQRYEGVSLGRYRWEQPSLTSEESIFHVGGTSGGKSDERSVASSAFQVLLNS